MIVARLLLLALLVIPGCSALRPRPPVPEPVSPPSDAPFWTQLQAVRPEDWFHLLNEGEEALEWRLRMIDSARDSIDLETFLWKPDQAGREILAHVLAAADRGVRVRFLLDDSFTMHEDLALHALSEHPGISFRIYNPFQRRSDSVVWRQLFNLGEFSRINHRMHNKVLLVDGRAALVGGRNLADEYFGRHRELNFRDMEVITMGSSLPGIVEHFEGFWSSPWSFPVEQVVEPPEEAPGLDAVREALAGVGAPEAPESEELAAEWQALAEAGLPGDAEFFFDDPIPPSPVRREPHRLAEELHRLIDSARSEVVLVSAYLVPTPALEELVERVEARGVRVRILTNSLQSNNHLAAHAAYHGHLRRLLDHGADLHEVRVRAADRELYMRGPVADKKLGLHAKLLLVDDDQSFVGSCNLDPRSLEINTEVGLVIESPELNQRLRELLEIDFAPRNAWAVRESEDGELIWVGEEQTLHKQPADSGIHRLEDWFIGLLPIDDQV